MISTSILGLKKAEITDNADLTVFINDNMDILESAIDGKVDSSHTHTLANITDSGSLAAINTNASTVNYLRGDGLWITPPNDDTTYSAGTGLSLVGTTFNVDSVFNASGTYASLRAQATTYGDVGAAPTVHTHDYVPLTRTVNGKALSSDIVLTASDVGAANGDDYLPLAGGAMTGDLTITKVGDAMLQINADSPNTDEYANPVIHLTQDGGGTESWIGIDQNNELYLKSDANAIYFKDTVDGNHEIWHSNNLTPSDYLPLAGGVLTGKLTVNDEVEATTGFKTVDWTIKQNADGSLGFFTV